MLKLAAAQGEQWSNSILRGRKKRAEEKQNVVKTNSEEL